MSGSTKIWLGFVLLVGLTGCSTLTDGQRMCLADGERALREKQYSRAIERMSTFLEQVRNPPEVARAYYVRGMARALSGQRAWAYADLQRAVTETRDPQVTWQPQAMLGVLCFEDDNWDAAARAFKAAVDKMPASPPQDALLFRLGLCAERMGRWSAATSQYRLILQRFPRGVYAAAAARRTQLGADHFAVQCGVFSRSENANQLVARLRAEGLQVYSRPEPRQDGSSYVVLEGRYASYQDANQALGRVRGYVPDAVLWP